MTKIDALEKKIDELKEIILHLQEQFINKIT